MATETKLRQLAQGGCPVYYFYSSERYLVRQAVARAAKLLAEGEDEETTVLDGAAPEIEQLIMAAGTISFFGTRRVVLLPEVDPAAYSDKDLDELCATLASLENAVVVLGSVFEMERNKLKLGKRAQKLIAQCTKVGFAEELAKPKPYELKVMVMDRAKAQDTTLSEGTATALLDYLVRQAVARAAKLLAEGEDEETTVLDGAAPEIEQLIMAAGTISFFGTRRVVLLPEVDPAAYSDKDLDELCATLASLENAVVVLGSVFEMERNKLKLGKRAQKLIAQCTKVGFAEELAKPKPYELKVMVMDRAKAQDTTLSEGTATALLERCGEDPFLLENEVDKLCALSGYQTVTTAMVAEMGTVSLEADVFEMIRMITAKNATGACKKLQTLLRLQQEPIPITAAMIGSYVDLYRVKLGAAKRKSYSTVFKDFGYKGSDYRLKRSAETASHYTLPQLEACMQILLELDKSLKSQPVSAQTLLETALCRLAMAGGRR